MTTLCLIAQATRASPTATTGTRGAEILERSRPPDLEWYVTMQHRISAGMVMPIVNGCRVSGRVQPCNRQAPREPREHIEQTRVLLCSGSYRLEMSSSLLEHSDGTPQRRGGHGSIPCRPLRVDASTSTWMQLRQVIQVQT